MYFAAVHELKRSGAALMMFITGVAGVVLCLITGRKLKKYHYNDM